jgi:hypothetical protein
MCFTKCKEWHQFFLIVFFALGIARKINDVNIYENGMLARIVFENIMRFYTLQGVF